MIYTTTHPHAQIAIRAAKLRPSIGNFAAVRYCQRQGCPLKLYTLARILEAAKAVDNFVLERN